jgi:hypothetical protein
MKIPDWYVWIKSSIRERFCWAIPAMEGKYQHEPPSRQDVFLFTVINDYECS